MKGPALFIYWHVSPGDASAAEAAALAFQSRLRAEGHGVAASLYRRSDADPLRVTLMETYVADPGLSPELQSAVLIQSAQALERWALKGRHVEVFSPVV